MTEEQKNTAVAVGQAAAQHLEAALQNAVRQALNDGVSINNIVEMKRRIEAARVSALKDLGITSE